MSPRDRRGGAADDGGGGSGEAAIAPGKRTRTQGLVQKKDLDGITSLSMRPPKSGFDRLPDSLKPAEPAEVSDRIARFRAALDRGDRKAAEHEWLTTTPEEHAGFASSPSIDRELRQVKSVMGTMLIAIMDQCGLRFGDRPELLTSILRDKAPEHDWLEALSNHPTLWHDFTDTLPTRAAMTEADAAGIKPFIDRTGSESAAKKLFGRVYSPLRDDSYDAATLHTHPWKIEWIRRLYKVLSEHVPVGHVRTVQDFSIGFEYKNHASDRKFKPLGYGWWNRKGRHIVLPEKSSEGGRKTTHNMTGGKGGGQVINHHDVTALHEVGHGVGQELGGNAWAETFPWVGWKTGMDADAWSKGLWGDDATLTAEAEAEVGAGKALPADEARRYLAHAVAGTPYSVASPRFRTTRKVEDFIKKHYADEKLTTYWKHVAKVGRESAYRFKSGNNVADDGRVYVYLTRGDNKYSSYSQAAYERRVSWYSLASVREWFAEQYAHYYRTSPHGTGMEEKTKEKLDELHGAKYAAPVGDGVIAPDFGGGGDNDAGDGAADSNDRLPFPW